jgi:NADH dehydrogenase
MSEKRKKIVLVGGGFAGVAFAKKMRNSDFEILLIDKQNHHQFQPLFYQVACSMLEPASIIFPFRRMFQGFKNMEYRMATVLEVNDNEKFIVTDVGNFEYDYLILAQGCKTNFFGNEEIENHALTLKSTQEAIEIRNHILSNFEAVLAVEGKERDEYLNIVIVGAGPTGVELAGSFAEMKNKILPKDYTFFDFSKLNIILLEGSPNTLNPMSENARKASRTYLENMGVIVRTETVVKNFDGHEITLKSGEKIPSRNVIWAAGVTGNKIEGLDKATIVKANRLSVNRLNLVHGYNNIFALGDIAYMETPLYPHGHPQVANVAVNQAKNLAKNLLSDKPISNWKEYEYKDLGSMATIGKNKAVVDLPRLKFKGWFAWIIWMFLHLMLILTVRNKLIILINWAGQYFSSDSSLRVILGKSSKRKL